MTEGIGHVHKRRETAQSAESNGHVQQNGHIQKESDHSLGAQKDPSQTPAESSESSLGSILKIWLPAFGLIFGGCCSNVYALESLISLSPTSGSLITFLQFSLVSLFTLPYNLSRSPGTTKSILRRRKVPLIKWLVYTALFLAINILNNYAFGYKISVPLHIILRSAGPVMSMGVGYLFGSRTYPPHRIAAVIILFLGVVVAAISDAYSKLPEEFETIISISDPGIDLSSNITRITTVLSSPAFTEQAPGFGLLLLALLLSAIMGLYSDKLYSTYGHSAAITTESLFYSHVLPLPFFLLQSRTLRAEFSTVTTSSSPILFSLPPKIQQDVPSYLQDFLGWIPRALPLLLVNAFTQFICISGVNRLSATSSSLTVSIVLNIRKLVSLLLSIWLFGNRLSTGVLAGAVLVFLGGGLYALPSRTHRAKQGKIKGQ